MNSNNIRYKIGLILYTYMKYLILIFLLSLICGLLNSSLPLIPGVLVDAIIDNTDRRSIYYLIFAFLVVTILNTLISYLKNIIIIKSESEITNSLINNIINDLFHAEYKNVAKYDSTYLTHRIYNDIKIIIRFIIGCISTSSLTFVVTLVSLIILYRVNYIFALITLISIPFYVFFLLLLKKQMQKINYTYKERQDLYVSQINEQITMLEEIKINTLYKSSLRLIDKAFVKLYDATYNSYKLNYKFVTLNVIVNSIIQLIFFGIGISLVFDNKITIGMFSIVNILYFNVLSGIKYFLDFSKQMQEIKVSQERMNALLNIPKESTGNKKVNDSTLQICTKNFSYEFSASLKINFPEVIINKNGLHLIVGDNGAGKTTFVRILIGLLGKEHNQIFYNNEDIRLLDIDQFRAENFSFVSQEPGFWNTTVAENFELFLEDDLSYDTIMKKIYSINFDKILSEEFFSPELWERNINELSVGQKKRIMLCIQFLRNRKIIIMDEPNASLDQEAIANLRAIIQCEKQNHIIIIITHDYNYADLALQKIVINGNG